MTLFPRRIVTDRLELRPLTPEYVDVHEFYRICSGQVDGDFEDVTRYVTWSPHEHPKETSEFLQEAASQFEAGESAQYVLRPRSGDDAGEIAGASGMSVDWDRRLANLGIWLRRPFWGRGYSGERAAALIEVAFDHLDLEVVAVTHEAGNENSRRAVEKYVDAHGGRHEGLLRNFVADQDGGVTDAHRYTINREEYRETDTPEVGTQVEF